MTHAVITEWWQKPIAQGPKITGRLEQRKLLHRILGLHCCRHKETRRDKTKPWSRKIESQMLDFPRRHPNFARYGEMQTKVSWQNSVSQSPCNPPSSSVTWAGSAMPVGRCCKSSAVTQKVKHPGHKHRNPWGMIVWNSLNFNEQVDQMPTALTT